MAPSHLYGSDKSPSGSFGMPSRVCATSDVDSPPIFRSLPAVPKTRYELNAITYFLSMLFCCDCYCCRFGLERPPGTALGTSRWSVLGRLFSYYFGIRETSLRETVSPSS